MKRYITTAEAAQILGYTPQGTSQLLRQGKIKGQMFGSRWLVDSVSLRLFMKNQKNDKLSNI